LANPSLASAPSAVAVLMRSSFASIAILVFESLQCRSAIKQAACELVRVRLRALGGMQSLGLIRAAAVCTIAHPHVAGGMEAVHKSNGRVNVRTDIQKLPAETMFGPPNAYHTVTPKPSRRCMAVASSSRPKSLWSPNSAETTEIHATLQRDIRRQHS
jgi:hypothetical protein